MRSATRQNRRFFTIFGICLGLGLSAASSACYDSDPFAQPEATGGLDTLGGGDSGEEAITAVCTADCEDDTQCGDDFCVEGSCVSCLSDDDCGGQYCLEGSCVECLNDDHCSMYPERSRCGTNPAGGANTCICNVSADCAAPMGACRSTGCVCSEDAGCAGIGPERCYFGACITCDDDSHCGAGEKCFDGGTPNAYCGCADDSACTEPGKSACGNDGTCSCRDDADCVSAGLGDVCDDGACRCSDATTCTATRDDLMTWACQ